LPAVADTLFFAAVELGEVFYGLAVGDDDVQGSLHTITIQSQKLMRKMERPFLNTRLAFRVPSEQEIGIL